MSLNVIKEYLVKIGAAIDIKSFDNVTKVFAKMSKNINAAMAGLTVAITTAVVAFMDKIAQSDLAIQKLAISLYTTVENARSLKTVMDTMGLKDLNDLKYVNLIPEQRKQFLELRKLSKGLEPGDETKQGLKDIRAVGYEVQKLQVIFSYFWTYVAGALAKLLSGPMKKLVEMLTSFSKNFQKNISNWSNYFAAFLTIFVRIFEIGGKLVQIAAKLLELIPFFNKIPTLLKLIIDVTLYLLNKIEKVLDRIQGLDIKKGAQEWGKAITGTAEKVTKQFNKGATEWKAAIKKTFHLDTPKKGTASKVVKPRKVELSNNSTLSYLKEVARRENLRITSTTGGTHNKGSKHYKGQAIDFDHRGITANVVERLRNVYGLRVLDERVRPKGQAVWGGSHFHADINPDRAAKYASQLQMTAQTGVQSKTAPANITINVNGAKDPHLTAEAVNNKLQNTLNARNMRGIYI